MKKFITFITGTILFALILFTAASFIHLSFNPSNWHIVTRTVSIVIYIGLLVGYVNEVLKN